MTNCYQCGAQVSLSDIFCQNCGSPLSQDNKSNQSYGVDNKRLLEVNFKSKHAESLYRESLEYINPRNLDIKKSFDTLQMAYNIEPDNPLILSQLGLIYFTAGQNEEAIDFLERALLVDPGNVIALEILVEVYKREGDPEKVEKYFNQLKNKGPDYAESFVSQGDKHFEEGEFNLASTVWKKALTLEPNNPEILMRLNAISEIDKRDKELEKFYGDYKKAKDYNKLILKKDPENTHAKLMLLWVEKKDLGLKF